MCEDSGVLVYEFVIFVGGILGFIFSILGLGCVRLLLWVLGGVRDVRVFWGNGYGMAERSHSVQSFT